MKKLILIVLCIGLLCSAISASANDEWGAIGGTPYTTDYVYVVENETVTLINGNITDSNGVAVIPSSIEGYPVTTLADSLFFVDAMTKKIIIPDTVTTIHCNFNSCMNLTEIEVDPNNQTFSSIDGNLFNKNNTTIIRYPTGKTAPSYTIPDSVTTIAKGAFKYCKFEIITIPSGVTKIESEAFSGPYLKDIYFAGSQEQWENAVGQANLELNENATIHFNSTGNHTPEISVLVNNQAISFDQPPVIENDRTLVPLRAIFEALGAEVLWDGETSTVTATRGDITISLQIGSNQLYKNGEAITIDVPAQIINDRTMVPVRAIAESFNCRVGWDSDTKTVTITE